MIIGIAGSSGSGKTTIVNQILSHFSSTEVTLISQDSYYKEHNHLSLLERKKLNFDHPDSIEWDLLCSQLGDLKNGKTVEQPVYSFVESNRTNVTVTTIPAPIIIIEGILIYTQPKLRELIDKKYWIHVSNDIRLWRIILRDTSERGKSLALTLQRYRDTVRPMHVEYIDPCIEFADELLYNDSFTEAPDTHHVVDYMKNYLIQNKY